MSVVLSLICLGPLFQKMTHYFSLNGSLRPTNLKKNLKPWYLICIIHIVASDYIWPFLPPYMGVIPNPKMAFIFPISCILLLIFPSFMIYFPKSEGKGRFPKSQIKALAAVSLCLISARPCTISLFSSNLD